VEPPGGLPKVYGSRPANRPAPGDFPPQRGESFG
jgi:hypothetical protein